jgi:hypothetical protein
VGLGLAWVIRGFSFLTTLENADAD